VDEASNPAHEASNGAYETSLAVVAGACASAGAAIDTNEKRPSCEGRALQAYGLPLCAIPV
jgi:hypothetical protein